MPTAHESPEALKKRPVSARLTEGAFWLGYALIPISAGLWFYDQIECIYFWRILFKDFFSSLGYFALPTLAVFLRIKDVEGRQLGLALIGSATALMPIGAALNVVHKCW